MSHQLTPGPFCQSCGMPLATPDDLGTDPREHRVSDYCHHCFSRGAFTEPWISMQGMIERTVAIMVKQGIMPQAQAMSLMSEVMPRLKRWQEARRGQSAAPAWRAFRRRASL